MQIKVFSKQGIRKATPKRKTILIAINDVADITKSRNYITRDKYAGILWLYFDDIESEKMASFPSLTTIITMVNALLN